MYYYHLWIAIHPFSATYQGPGSQGQQCKQKCTDLPLPSYHLQLFRHQDIPKPAKRCNLCSMSWLCLSSFSSCEMPTTPAPERHLVRCLNHINPLRSMWRAKGSTLSPSQTPSSLPCPYRLKPSHPSEEAQFSDLDLWSSSFGLYPEITTTGVCRKVDQPVNRQLSFHHQLNSPQQTSTKSTSLLTPHQSISPFSPQSSSN